MTDKYAEEVGLIDEAPRIRQYKFERPVIECWDLDELRRLLAAARQEIWQTLRVPLDEHHSFTAVGRPWPNHEWLWQALSYGLYRAGGMPLLTAGGAGIVVGALAIAYRLTVGATATRFLLTVLAVPVTASVPSLSPSPRGSAFKMLPLCDDSRRTPGARAYWPWPQ